MITCVSLVTVYCLNQDETRDFYVDVLGFEPGTDITMGEGFRWVTVKHPSQPELEVTLMTPGPPLDTEAAAGYRGRRLCPAPTREGRHGRARPVGRRLPQDLRLILAVHASW
ncbi:VOC family protein [Mycobacterium sp.]|uniref:VOC family protein n=1 Tax=Mycobacterium sp. TaxID=1785 RepID=UPI002D9A5BAF|nr:VOC family protein [Mycobacterium sp.]